VSIKQTIKAILDQVTCRSIKRRGASSAQSEKDKTEIAPAPLSGVLPLGKASRIAVVGVTTAIISTNHDLESP